MSILIRGVKMPECCEECPCYRHDSMDGVHAYQCNLTLTTVMGHGRARLDNCPLSYVPPYTRLIDAETLYCRLVNEPIRAVDGIPFDADWWTRIADAYGQAIDAVEQAPTIIEAEGEEE